MNDAICPECGNDNLTDYPVCPLCATRWHFPHRAVCLHCEHKREAEQNDASTVLWLNNTDPDLDAIGRYADPLHDECDGMGIVRECGEWAFCSCTNAALLAAAKPTA